MNKKVAIITPVFPPYRGGIGTVAYHQARVLGGRGCEVVVLTPDYGYPGSSRPSPRQRRAGLPSPEGRGGFVTELLKPVLKYGNAAWVPSLEERLKDFNVVILQYPFFGGMRAVYKAKKKYGFKLIVNYNMDVVATLRQGFGWSSSLKGLVFWYATKFFLPRIIKIADFVLASSEDYAQHSQLGRFWQAGNPKFQIIPNGVDINRFALSDVPREPIILFVGGLDKAHYFKGVDFLIKAMSILSLRAQRSNPEINSGIAAVASTPASPELQPGFAEALRQGERGELPRNDSVKLVIAGKGELAETYKKLAQDLGVGDRVEFAGGVSDAELVKLYQRAAVTVLPSIDQSEAFGIVLVESMSCGTPVIASDLPGVRSVFEEGVSGFTVPPRESQTLAERINYILDNPDKAREMGQAGRRLVEERYDWKVIGGELCKLSELLLFF